MATLLENLSIEKYFKQSPPEFTAWSQNKLVDYLHQLVDDPDSVQYADAFFDVVDPNTDSDWIFYNTSLDKTNFMLLRQAAEKHDSLQAALCALYQLSCKEQNIEKFKTVNHINNTGQVWHEMAQNNSAKNNWVRQAINNRLCYD